MYVFLIIYSIFLLGFMGFSAFIIYYALNMGVGRKAKIGLLIYCLIAGMIIAISLILLSTCKWSWGIQIPKI